MKNILKLHEAIAVVLLSCAQRKAGIDFIAGEINRRNLYTRKDGKPLPAYQVKQRVCLSKGRYRSLFAFDKGQVVQLQ